MMRGLLIAVLLLFLILPYLHAQGNLESEKEQPKSKAEQGGPETKFPFPFLGAPKEKKSERLLKLSLEPKAVLKPDNSFKIEVKGKVENLTSKVFNDAKLTIGLLAINQKIDFNNTEFSGKGEKGDIKRKGSFERKIRRIAASGVENFSLVIQTPPNTNKEGLQLAVMGIVEAKADAKGEPTQAYSIVSLKDIKSEK